MLLLVFAFIVAWGGIGWVKSAVNGKEFAGAVRSTIRLNPRMKRAEFVRRLNEEARRLGVEYNESDLIIRRGGGAVLAGSSISEVTVRFRVPTSITLFSFERQMSATVAP